jgi:protoporphyrinogen oxidase
VRTAILGGGVSGLTLARRLREAGLECVVFEAAAKTGGLCASESVDGYTYDVAGGHILYSKDRTVLDWMIAQVDGGCERRERHTKIYLDGRFVHYPFENGLGDLDKPQTFECLMGYLDAAWKRRNGARAPKDFRDWISYRFGEGIARIFMRPYNEKIWKHPLEDLSTEWVEGRVPDAPIEDVVRAAIGLRTEGYAHQAIFYYPRRGGFQAIADGIAKPIRDVVRLRTPAAEVRRAGATFRVNGEEFDRVVSTIPLPELAKILPELDPSARDAARDLRFTSLTTVAIGVDHGRLPPYSWVYLPSPEQGPANRITYLTNYSAEVAPAGKGLILAEATCAGEPRKDAAFVREIVDGLERAGLLRRSEVSATHASSVRYAYIVFDLGFRARLDAALAGVHSLGVETLGRFGRFEYVNSDHCVAGAFALAARMIGEARTGASAPAR